MNVVLVHDWLTGMRGGEKCLEPLCRRFPDARLVTLLHRRGSTSPAIERMRITSSFLQWLPRVTRYYRYTLPWMPAAIERIRLPRDTDLVVSLSHAVAKSIRVPHGVPHVCYCFTPMRYAWQRRADYFNETSSAQSARQSAKQTLARPARWCRDTLLDLIRDWDARTQDRVTHFVAISQTVAGRIRDCYGRTSRIIYPPVDTEFYTPSCQARENFYLCVSALVPYKRIDLAIHACNQLGRQLVVIGQGPEYRRLAQLASPNVRLLGYQSDEVVRHHLRRAKALLFPGHEDFGIVPVEAQACGTPVIAFAEGGATETVLPGDVHRSGTGVLFQEQSTGSLVEAIQWLERHPHQLSSDLARKQSLQFSLARFERELFTYLDEVIRGDEQPIHEAPRRAA